MGDVFASRVLTMRLAYVGLGFIIMFFHLIPLDTVPRQWAPPDFLIAFTFAIVLRRPEYAPPWLIAGVMLLADFLLQRPPGLLAAFVVLGADFLVRRSGGLSEASFFGEWTAVAIVMAAIVAAYRFCHALLLIDQAPLMLALVQGAMTIAVYPLVVGFTQGLFRIRKPRPSDNDLLGGRT